MTDIQTGWSAATGTGDWVLIPVMPGLWTDQAGAPITDEMGVAINAIVDASTTLDFINDLTTVVLISLFTDAAADDDDIIPDGTANRRGWWGDDAIGSKLWLLERSKALPTVADQAKGYIEAALTWLVTAGVATSIEATTRWLSGSALLATVVIRRGELKPIGLSFANLWDFT